MSVSEFQQRVASLVFSLARAEGFACDSGQKCSKFAVTRRAEREFHSRCRCVDPGRE